MLEVTPDKKLLSYLVQFGIGNHKQIAPLLKEMFPPPDDENGFKGYRKDIADFLIALKKHDFITLNEFALNFDGHSSVKAAILAKGIDFLNADYKAKSISQIHIEGSGNQIINQSPSSRFNDNSQTASTIKKPPTKISTILNNWKLGIGIILGIVTVWAGVQPLIKSNSNKKSKDSTIFEKLLDTTTKKDSDHIPKRLSYIKDKKRSGEKYEPTIDSAIRQIEFPFPNSSTDNSPSKILKNFKVIYHTSTSPLSRHVEQNDVDEILKLASVKQEIFIKYKNGDEEAKVFSYELKAKLEEEKFEVIVTDLLLFVPLYSLNIYPIRFIIDNTADSAIWISIPPIKAK